MALLKKIFRIVVGILASVLLLLIVGWGILYFYFSAHKKEIIAKASTEISSKIQAGVTIKDAGISWFATFPYISIELREVQITDTLYSKHPIPFLQAGKFYANCNVFQLMKGQVRINRVGLSDGIINVIHDSLCRPNLHILDAKSPSKTDTGHSSKSFFNDLTMNNVRIFIVDDSRQVKLDILVNKLKCSTIDYDTATCFNLDMKVHTNYLGFNTVEGYYGNNKDIDGVFPLYLNMKQKTIRFHDIKLAVNHDLLIGDGIFHFDEQQLFHLSINAPNIDFENAKTAMVAKSQLALSGLHSVKPVDFAVVLDGDTRYLSIPFVNVAWRVSDDELGILQGKFAHCSMRGTFINYVNPKNPRHDSNSRITVSNFKALWNGKSPVQANKIIITNMIKPILHFDLNAVCTLSDIDSLVQSNDLNFEDGNANINIVYNGPVSYSSKIVPDITGYFMLSKADILYAPRNMELVNGNAKVSFNHSEIAIENLSGTLGKSSIAIQGHINSFAPIFSHANEQVLLQWTVASPLINLTELVPLVAEKQQKHRAKKIITAPISGLSSFLDDLVEECNIQVDFLVKRIVYNHFEADNLNANLSLENNGEWKINHLLVNHAGGNLSASGTLAPLASGGYMASLKSDMQHVDVSKVMYAFNDFGIRSFSSNNLKGQLTLHSTLEVALNKAGNIAPNTIKAKVGFSLQNGELVKFRPIEEVCKKIFPNRNFEDIQFADLKDNVTISDNLVKMNKMEVSSNLLHFYVEGTYGMKITGTDILVQIPLNNLSAPEINQSPDNLGLKAKNGISVFVNAKDNGNGDIKLSYSLDGKKKPKKSKSNNITSNLH